MSTIVVNHVVDLEPELAAIARPLVAKWEAAIYRVAASHVQPTFLSFTPAARSPEAILGRRFKELPAVKKQFAGEKAVKRLKESRIQKRLGITGLDLTAARPIEQILKKEPPGISKEKLLAIAKARVGTATGASSAAAVPGSLTSLRLELIRMVCVDETDGLFGTESGEDEIKLGGSALQETTDVGKIGPHDLGDFNDWGNLRQKDYSPPKELFKFDLKNAKTFPNAYFAVLLLAEIDQGGFNETVNEIIEELKKESTEYLAALIGGQIGVAGGPLGALVGLIVGYAVGRIVSALVKAWNDDLFEARTIEVIVPSADATFDGKLTQKSQVIRFTGSGHYAMRYQWAVEKVSQPVVA